MSTAPVIVGTVYATPQMVQRDFAARRAAGAVEQGEAPPAPVYRSLMQMESPDDEPQAEPGRYPFVMSAATPDGADDIVEQSWNLERFAKNPVAFLNHNSWSLPIGRWENVRVEGGMLRGVFVPSQAHELATVVAKMLDEKTLRCASVGFIPGKATDRSKFPADHPMYAARGYVYSENMLLECSVVSIPMHPDAVMERAADPAPQPEATPAPVERAADPQPVDGPDFDLDGFAAALATLFPSSAS